MNLRVFYLYKTVGFGWLRTHFPYIVEGRRSHNTLLTFIAQNYDGTKDVL